MKSLINSLTLAVFTTATALIAPACVLEIPGDDSTSANAAEEARMERGEVCVKTFCDYKTEQCIESCNECIKVQASIYGSGNLDPCSYPCGPKCNAAACASNRCLRKEVKFTVTGKPDKDLQRACEHFAAARKETIDCRQLAIAQKPELAQVYECEAEAVSDDTKRIEDCPTVTARGTLGDEICEQFGSCNEKFCSDPVRDAFNVSEVIASSDSIVRAARECFEQEGCGAVQSCLLDWVNALYGIE